MSDKKQETPNSEPKDNSGADVVVEAAAESTEDKEALTKANQIAEDQKRRAEKAEKKLQDLKTQLEAKDEGTEEKTEPKPEGQVATPVTTDGISKEETILYAKGFSEDEVEKIKSIAKIEGESPLVAAESDYFTIWKEKQDNEAETKETQLGASRGSAHGTPTKDFSENLSKDDHKALWREKMGR